MKTQEDFDKAWRDVLHWARKKLTEIAAELAIHEPDHSFLEKLIEEKAEPGDVGAELDRLDETIKQTLHLLVDEACVGWRAECANYHDCLRAAVAQHYLAVAGGRREDDDDLPF